MLMGLCSEPRTKLLNYFPMQSLTNVLSEPGRQGIIIYQWRREQDTVDAVQKPAMAGDEGP